MHNCADDIRGKVKRISHQPVIDALVRAIETCPEKRDSRHPEKILILEPHYKLVSVVHKLVCSKRITVGRLRSAFSIMLMYLLRRSMAVSISSPHRTHERPQRFKMPKIGMTIFCEF